MIALLAAGYVSVSFFSIDRVLGLGKFSYISPDGLVNQDQSKPTSFGDADDLPQVGASVPSLAPGTSIVSGHVTDAATGLPVANANVGISLGVVGSGATYATTAADGSYSFPGLANGTYNLASSRYTISGSQPLYAYSTRMGVVVNANTSVDFSLNPIATAGSRPNQCNRATNFLLIDYDETYFESWFTDPNSMMNNSPAIHSIAQGRVNATEHWTSYGWSRPLTTTSWL